MIELALAVDETAVLDRSSTLRALGLEESRMTAFAAGVTVHRDEGRVGVERIAAFATEEVRRMVAALFRTEDTSIEGNVLIVDDRRLARVTA